MFMELLTPPSQVIVSITSTLAADPLSRDILRFLLDNESAMDSAKGIAAWWVHTDEFAVQPSLHRLSACGAILAHTLSSGLTFYGLTHDPEVRTWLRNTVGLPDPQRASSDRPLRHRQSLTDASII